MMNTTFVVMSRFVATNTTFVMTKQSTTAQQLHFSLIYAICPSLYLVFIQNLQNTIKLGIRSFFSDISVNLALKLYKTREKYTKNANKIQTY